ncbi:MAG: bifunctional oligoribonuclease/PAP phosphatase NrnA [Vampirovibrionales bacterium]|nr:bifunctional oligoribonuclease/PAP phosphatase NrnA [Vampirovibrionales bacterium]
MRYSELKTALEQAKSVLLMPHVGPDADSLGSVLGMKFAIEKTWPTISTVHVVMDGALPVVYGFLPGSHEVANIETATHLLHEPYDVAIAADCGSVDRLGEPGKHFKQAKTSVNIDHHVSNDYFGTLNIVETDAGASGLVIARILEEWGVTLDANIAPNLYAAIVTDTGGFKYSSTSVEIFTLAAQLMAAGANPETIYKEVYENRPLGQVMLQAETLMRTQFSDCRQIAWTAVTRHDLNKHHCLDEHVDGLIEQIRNIDTVKLAAVFKENRDGSTKVSFRSDDHAFDVSKVAGHFGGGGHKMASGCTIADAIDDAKPQVLALLETLLSTMPCRS